MALKLEMEFIIEPDGSVRVTTVGLTGAEQKDALKPIELVLGPLKERSLSDHHHGQSKRHWLLLNKKERSGK
jgi:hypothetical protein